VEFAKIKHLIRECSPLKTIWAHSRLRFPKKSRKELQDFLINHLGPFMVEIPKKTQKRTPRLFREVHYTNNIYMEQI